MYTVVSGTALSWDKVCDLNYYSMFGEGILLWERRVGACKWKKCGDIRVRGSEGQGLLASEKQLEYLSLCALSDMVRCAVVSSPLLLHWPRLDCKCGLVLFLVSVCDLLLDP